MDAKKKILFFTCEPGGAEVLSPVIKLLSENPAFDIFVSSYGFANPRFEKNGIQFINISPVERNQYDLFDKFFPELIITSATSLPERDMSEKNIWMNAKDYNIPTIAFLDQWQNYAIRFSGTSPQERLTFLPDFINCINEIGKREMVAEGFESNMLVEFGHPYLTSLQTAATEINKIEILNKLNFNQQSNVLLFASEAIREHFGNSRGYTQYDSLALFLNIAKSKPEAKILVKLHPKDSIDHYVEMINSSGLNVKLIQNELTSLECISIADEVYGMTSIMLIEAYVLGKKVISIQPNLSGVDLCILSRYKAIPVITKRDSSIGDLEQMNFKFQWQPEKFTAFLESKLKV